MRLSDIKTETVHAEETWVVEISKQGWHLSGPSGDRHYQYDSYDDAFAKVKRILDRYDDPISNERAISDLTKKGQFELFDLDGSWIGYVKLYRGTAPLRGRRGVNEYFGQMGGVNQVSSYVGTGTSGKSLTPREKRQLAKSKQKKCGDTCPCWDCKRTTADGRIDRIKSHYNEAEDKPQFTLALELEPGKGSTVDDLLKFESWFDNVVYSGVDRDSNFVSFGISARNREELDNLWKQLRRMKRGKPSFNIVHHSLIRLTY